MNNLILTSAILSGLTSTIASAASIQTSFDPCGKVALSKVRELYSEPKDPKIYQYLAQGDFNSSGVIDFTITLGADEDTLRTYYIQINKEFNGKQPVTCQVTYDPELKK